MSSGTPVDPYAGSNVVNSGLGDIAAQGGGSAGFVGQGMSQRQMRLNRFWSYYRCLNYESRRTDWNGMPVADHLEHEMIASQGFVPAGFVDAGQSLLPLKFRRPSVPYYLAKIIVDRFTGLLFSESRHPEIVVQGDPDTEDYLRSLTQVGRLMAQMHHARTYGGAQGSVAIGFQLVDGVPQFEVHDPRWCFPTFENRVSHHLAKFEQRYTFTEEVRTREGDWMEVTFWYRRLITKTKDTVWPKVPVEGDEEPVWKNYPHNEVEHNLGICPVVWIQNVRVDDDIDGDPDCHGVFEMIEAIDTLLSQAHRGVVANCDPSLHMASEDEIPELQKGSGTVIKTGPEGQVSYLEITGSGPQAARDLAKELREYALEVAACVPDNTTQGPAMTATEVLTRLSRMLERADVMREQYGEGMKRLMEIALRACQKVEKPTLVPVTDTSGNEVLRSVRGKVRIPPKIDKDPETGKVIMQPRKLGWGGIIELQWPKYMQPSLEDTNKAAAAVATAMAAGGIDREVAVDFLKQYFPIDDAEAMIKRIDEQQSGMQDEMNSALLSGINRGMAY